MSKVWIEENTLTNIADAIRNKRGSNERINPSNFANEILAISGGGGSSVENSFTVNFHDSDNELIESHTAKVGNLIGSPLSISVIGWENNDGVKITLPISSNIDGEIIYLYASEGTYSDMLYNHFGVDKAVYPYVLIKCNSTLTNVNLYFMGSFVVIAGNAVIIKNAMGYSQCNLSTVTDITLSNIVNGIINANPSMEQTVDSLHVSAESGSYVFSNTNIYATDDSYYFEVFE